jgi:hypothetical protein
MRTDRNYFVFSEDRIGKRIESDMRGEYEKKNKQNLVPRESYELHPTFQYMENRLQWMTRERLDYSK